jgi:hypothetical protein
VRRDKVAAARKNTLDFTRPIRAPLREVSMKTLSLLLMALLLCACSTPYRPPQLVDACTAYPGLIDLAAQAGTADVLLVHGIGRLIACGQPTSSLCQRE